jgi:hypothetical protein
MKTLLVSVAVVAAASSAAAQTATQAAAAAAPAVPSAAIVPSAAPAAIAVGSRVGDLPSGYDDGGRRDPFVTLVAPKRTASASATVRPRSGLAAVSIADVSVRGLVRSGTVVLAILEVPGKQSFVARVKDHLFDGVIQAIDPEGVTFTQQADGGAAAGTIRKALRAPGEEVR